MKVHILFEFQDGPWGGGNQFLKALREYFRGAGVYAEEAGEADVVLVNSHQVDVGQVLGLREGGAAVVHRIDGPVSLIRGGQRLVDRQIYLLNQMCADVTVFQSRWSRDENVKLGLRVAADSPVILNAPDGELFYPPGGRERGERVRIIGTSWSGNWRKGFDVYQYLDEHLDFERYSMTFFGNSPVEFRNIDLRKPMGSEELASELRAHDIFITASKTDPCSNSLIEALHCGLPAVVRNDGGHPEIVGDGGEVFDGVDDVVQAIDRVAADLDGYCEEIELPKMDEVGAEYVKACERAVRDKSARGGAGLRFQYEAVRFADRVMRAGSELFSKS